MVRLDKQFCRVLSGKDGSAPIEKLAHTPMTENVKRSPQKEEDEQQ